MCRSDVPLRITVNACDALTLCSFRGPWWLVAGTAQTITQLGEQVEALQRQLLEGGDAAEAARGEAEAQMRRQRAALEAEAQLRRQAEFAEVNAQVGALGGEETCRARSRPGRACTSTLCTRCIPVQRSAPVSFVYRDSECRSVCSWRLAAAARP